MNKFYVIVYEKKTTEVTTEKRNSLNNGVAFLI